MLGNTATLQGSVVNDMVWKTLRIPSLPEVDCSSRDTSSEPQSLCQACVYTITPGFRLVRMFVYNSFSCNTSSRRPHTGRTSATSETPNRIVPKNELILEGSRGRLTLNNMLQVFSVCD